MASSTCAGSSGSSHKFLNLHVILAEDESYLMKDGNFQFVCGETRELVQVSAGFVCVDKEVQILDDTENNISYIVHLKLKKDAEVLQQQAVNPEAIPQTPETEEVAVGKSGTLPCEVDKELTKIVWPEKIGKYLIDRFTFYKELKKKRKIKTFTEIWIKISKDLAEKNFVATPEQVSNKWKTVQRGYKAMTDHNKRSGRDRQGCSFQEDLEPILARDPNVNPPVTADPAGLKVWTEDGSEKDQTSVEMEGEVKSSKKNQVLVVLETMRAEAADRAVEREIERKRRHEEKMKREDLKNELLRRKIELLEKMSQKD